MCIEKNEYMGEYRKKNPEYAEKIKETNRQRYAMRKAAGICVSCGKEKADAPHVRCRPCFVKTNNAANKYQNSLEDKKYA